jgi:hypothetical protein
MVLLLWFLSQALGYALLALPAVAEQEFPPCRFSFAR